MAGRLLPEPLVAIAQEEGTMKFRRSFKEVCIRLVENEQGFVCTVQYGRFFRKTVQFPLSVEPDVLKDEFSPLFRTRRHFNAGTQDER